jgi:hypothetical protein
MRINLIDVDGTLCKSIFNNDRLKNDNKNCLKEDFLKDLAEVVPYEWWCPISDTYTVVVNGAERKPLRESELWGGQVCILVTGRLPVHEELTLKWFGKHCAGWEDAPAEVSFVSVPWDDTCTTREESYRKYVMEKGKMLEKQIVNWFCALRDSNIQHDIHVYEDDTNVLDELKARIYLAINYTAHVVDKNGEVHDYP